LRGKKNPDLQKTRDEFEKRETTEAKRVRAATSQMGELIPREPELGRPKIVIDAQHDMEGNW